MSKGRFEKIKNAILKDGKASARSDFSLESNGNRSFTVFGCIGIEEYGPTRISLYVRTGTVAFEGTCLTCDSYTNVGTVVGGYVERIFFCLSGVKK